MAWSRGLETDFLILVALSFNAEFAELFDRVSLMINAAVTILIV